MRFSPVAAACLLLLACWGSPAAAQEGEAGDAATQEGVTVAIVDFQRVVRESIAAEGIQEQIDVYRQSYQDEFGQIEERLRAIEDELAEARATLPADEFAQRRRAFEEQITEAQQRAQVSRAALDQALETAMDEVRSTLVDIIAQIARERDADLVLSQSQIILADRDLDVTETALARLNEELPEVEVIIPLQSEEE